MEEVSQGGGGKVMGFWGIKNSAQVGVLGIHLLPVARAGLVGFAFTNSPAAIPPWGGKKPLFGTNPIAAVFPRANEQPIVIDLALTTVVRGRIMMAMRKGERIPDGWAMDRNGKPTNDPKEAIEHGSLYPIGGSKGAMLALMFELICASLTRAAIGPQADSFFSEEGNRPRLCQAFIPLAPSALARGATYPASVQSARRTRGTAARALPRTSGCALRSPSPDRRLGVPAASLGRAVHHPARQDPDLRRARAAAGRSFSCRRARGWAGLRRQPAADRDSLPSRGRGERHRRLCAFGRP